MEKEEIVGAMCSGARRVFSMLILGAVVRGRPSTFEPSTCQQHQFAGRQKPNKSYRPVRTIIKRAKPIKAQKN